jgi:hypothetical protein
LSATNTKAELMMISNMTPETAHPCRTIADMPDHARVWIYKTPRPLGQAEQKLVRERGAAFTGTWAAHGHPLDACVEVIHDRFVVLAVDEVQARASGCSIDKSVGFIKQLELDLNLMLTDRMLVIFDREDKIMSCRLQELPDLLARSVITGETMIYDDLVATAADLRNSFHVPLKDSWLKRYL